MKTNIMNVKKDIEEIVKGMRKTLEKQMYDHSPADNGRWSDPRELKGAFEIIDDILEKLKGINKK